MEAKETFDYSGELGFMNQRFDLEEVEIDRDSTVLYNTKAYWYVFFAQKPKEVLINMAE